MERDFLLWPDSKVYHISEWYGVNFIIHLWLLNTFHLRNSKFVWKKCLLNGGPKHWIWLREQCGWMVILLSGKALLAPSSRISSNNSYLQCFVIIDYTVLILIPSNYVHIIMENKFLENNQYDRFCLWKEIVVYLFALERTTLPNLKKLKH